MPNCTTFDPQQRYILLEIRVADKRGKMRDFPALLDTGAPSSEFSDDVLQFLGFLKKTNDDVPLQPGLQTQKYGKILLPAVEVCAHTIENLQVYVSHFEKSWGIDALIGLDFFRRFRVTIDYEAGHLISELY